MKKLAEKIETSSIEDHLSDDLAALFANTPQLSDAEIRDLKVAARELDNDPEFVADYLKGLVVEEILRTLEETNTSKNELAKRIGKSRQYVSNVLAESSRVNFTLDTLAQFACALDRQLCVRILPRTQKMHVMRAVVVSPGLKFDLLTTNPLSFTVSEEDFQVTTNHDFCHTTAFQNEQSALAA